MSRISKERMEKALEQLKTISEADYAKVKSLAAIVKPLRSVLHKTPDDHSMTGWPGLFSSPALGTSLAPVWGEGQGEGVSWGGARPSPQPSPWPGQGGKKEN